MTYVFIIISLDRKTQLILCFIPHLRVAPASCRQNKIVLAQTCLETSQASLRPMHLVYSLSESATRR